MGVSSLDNGIRGVDGPPTTPRTGDWHNASPLGMLSAQVARLVESDVIAGGTLSNQGRHPIRLCAVRFCRETAFYWIGGQESAAAAMSGYG